MEKMIKRLIFYLGINYIQKLTLIAIIYAVLRPNCLITKYRVVVEANKHKSGWVPKAAGMVPKTSPITPTVRA